MCGALVSSGLLSGARVCLRTAGSAHEAWQTALLWKEMTAADITIATHDEALGLSANAHGLAVVASCTSTPAQELPQARLFPGSISVSSGTFSPTEAGDLTMTTTVDQGVPFWRSGSLFVLGYASISQRNDSEADVLHRAATLHTKLAASFGSPAPV
jgi:hypothetical protein